jgi:hypothetical protein
LELIASSKFCLKGCDAHEGRKSFALFSSSSKEGLCLELIASSKFCLKGCDAHEKGCGVQAHASKKILPEVDSFYLKENDGHAFTKPVFTVTGMSSLNSEILVSKTMTLNEWEILFEDLGCEC